MEYTTVCFRTHSAKGLKDFKQWLKECGITKHVVIETKPIEWVKDRGRSKITITGEKANMLFMLRWGGKIEQVHDI